MSSQRRIFSIFLALAMLLSLLASCDGGKKPPVEDLPAHECESPCADCGACQNEVCHKRECLSKCHCDSAAAGYGYFPNLSERMPAIHINTADGSNEWATRHSRWSKLMGLIDYTDATVSTADCEEQYLFSDAEAEVKVRGNYTLDYEKKPIRIKFKEKTGLLGLHGDEEYKSWVLLAEWKDLSMLNNTVAFYLGNTILGSEGLYCTDFRPVEVYLNGSYWGVYLLVEQQEVKDGRTGVPEVPKNYTGNDIGYFFEYDAYHDVEETLPDGDPTFVMDHLGVPATNSGYTVKSDINADSQLAFLKKYMNSVFFIAHQATRNGTYYKLTDDKQGVELAPEYTSAPEAVGAVIDISSLVATYILNEIACDLDVDWSSFYLSVDLSEGGDGRVTFEAPWDFDSSFGIIVREGRDCVSTDALYAAVHGNPWFQLVIGEEWFAELVRAKWAEIKQNGVKEGALELIALQKEYYRADYIENYTRWPSRLTNGNGEVIPLLNSYKNVETAQGLAADYLTDWLSRRFAYLDSLWGE